MAKLSALNLQLSEAATQRSQQLLSQIRERIAENGPISFAEYMERCLYTPELGYYAGDSTIFGGGGDFVTAPELGQLFAYGLAQHIRQLVAAIRAAGHTTWSLLEVGAGSGQLAFDLLQHLHELDCLPAEYLIVERSASLRQRQQEKLSDLPFIRSAAKSVSVRHVDTAPPAFVGVMVANEVLDALPVARIRWQGDTWCAMNVAWDAQAESLVWHEAALSDQETQLIRERQLDQRASGLPLPTPYTTELACAITPWLQPYAEALQCGAVILVDYGYPRVEYYHPQRDEGTLICHFRHQAHDDPLQIPGQQDLTAFVDFTAVAEAGDALGLEMMGYTSQAHFLLGSGVLQALEGITDPVQQARLAEQTRRLMLPGEMGERFQVMQLGRGLEEAGPGFSMDLSYRL